MRNSLTLSLDIRQYAWTRSGKLRKVKFKYSGMNIEAVLDKLSMARILSEKDGVYTVSAEVFGNGIDMWMKNQGDLINI